MTEGENIFRTLYTTFSGYWIFHFIFKYFSIVPAAKLIINLILNAIMLILHRLQTWTRFLPEFSIKLISQLLVGCVTPPGQYGPDCKPPNISAGLIFVRRYFL